MCLCSYISRGTDSEIYLPPGLLLGVQSYMYDNVHTQIIHAHDLLALDEIIMGALSYSIV